MAGYFSSQQGLAPPVVCHDCRQVDAEKEIAGLAILDLPDDDFMRKMHILAKGYGYRGLFAEVTFRDLIDGWLRAAAEIPIPTDSVELRFCLRPLRYSRWTGKWKEPKIRKETHRGWWFSGCGPAESVHSDTRGGLTLLATGEMYSSSNRITEAEYSQFALSILIGGMGPRLASAAGITWKAALDYGAFM